MLCPICKTDKPPEDFLGKANCFKCEYVKKMEIFNAKPKPCGICGTPIPQGRWKFCSLECAKKGKTEQNHVYWVYNIKIEKSDWKNFRF